MASPHLYTGQTQGLPLQQSHKKGQPTQNSMILTPSKLSLKIHLKEALRQLTASKLRAFLAILGILVGTAALIAMLLIGQLAENQILSQFRSLGINLLAVSIYSQGDADSSPNPHNTLALQDAENLVHQVPHLEFVAPYTGDYGNVIYQGNNENAATVGVTPSLFQVAHLSLQQGRGLSFLDQNQNDYFGVIGSSLAQQMAKDTGLPSPATLLNTQIQIGDSIFTIIGILNTWPTNFFFNVDFNNAILIPLSTALNIQKNASIDNLVIRVQSNQNLLLTQTQIKAYLSQHTYQQQVIIRSPKSLIDSMTASSQTMTVLLGLIGGISLLVGGIGIMNIMLVSVAERHREIGIRKAVGAKNRDIILQFLTEAVLLSLLGGIAGLLLGLIIAYSVALVKHWPFAIFIGVPLLGCLITILIGIFFGFYPAYKAAQLDPIETLRSE